MARRRVAWAPIALADLKQVVQFIGRNDRDFAKEFGKRVHQQARKLANFPEGARLVPESDDSTCREIFVGNYRLIYLVAADIVTIIAFFHGGRQIKRMLRQSGREHQN